jgi:hypothetical protein
MVLGECGAVDGVRVRSEIDVLEENVAQCHFVHHKSHMITEARGISDPEAEVFGNF